MSRPRPAVALAVPLATLALVTGCVSHGPVQPPTAERARATAWCGHPAEDLVGGAPRYPARVAAPGPLVRGTEWTLTVEATTPTGESRPAAWYDSDVVLVRDGFVVGVTDGYVALTGPQIDAAGNIDVASTPLPFTWPVRATLHGCPDQPLVGSGELWVASTFGVQTDAQTWSYVRAVGHVAVIVQP